MKYVLIFIDILSVFFASAAALQLGSEYQPNLPIFVLSFIIVRTGLQFLYFGSFVHRDFPLGRSLAQFLILLVLLPVGLSLPPFLETSFEFFSNELLVYYVFAPLTVLLVSALFQVFYKLEPYQN